MLIVSDRLNKIESKDDQLMNLEDFIEAANNGDLDIDEVFFDCACLDDQELYEALLAQFPEYGIKIRIFYMNDKSESPEYIPENMLEKYIESTSINNSSSNNQQIANNNGNENRQDGEQEEIDYEMMGQIMNTVNEFQNTDNGGKIYLFGSSKGGSGKTFTCLISARRYAKTHPNHKVAIADFDIIDGQVGLSIHVGNPTFAKFFEIWRNGNDSFEAMQKIAIKNEYFPQNVDFYLASKSFVINDQDYWKTVFSHLIQNYDAIFLDTAIDYRGYDLIGTLYKLADKIILTTSTSIKSVGSVINQINIISGKIPNEKFSPADGILNKINVVVTQCDDSTKEGKNIINTVHSLVASANAKILVTFGQFSNLIDQAEYFGRWALFDNQKDFNLKLDKINL